jgi:hypothetical protein
LKVFDFSDRGKSDLIIARSDGTVEIWGPTSDTTHEMRGSLKLDEAVCGLDCGVFSDARTREIIVSTYSGKIYGILDEDAKKPNLGSGSGARVKKENNEKMEALKLEIETLEDELTELKGTMEDEGVQVLPTNNKLNWKMSKIDRTNKFKILVDSQNPILTLCVECSKSIIVGQSDSPSTGIFSETPDEFSSQYNYCTFNFQNEPVSQFEFTITIIELGSDSHLYLFVLPSVASTVAQNISIPIKPLALHEPVDTIPADQDPGIVWNQLTVEGDFSIDELNTWMFNIMPNLSAKVDGDV